jgi:putative endopeptidase
LSTKNTSGIFRDFGKSETESIAEFRVNGVVFNVPEFYRAFPIVKPDEKLYRQENERLVIW